MRLLLCGLLLASLAGQSLALGREVPYAEAREQFASLRQVVDCGTWRLQAASGDLRLLRYSLYGQDLLFVDRIGPAGAGERWQVERGYGFAEINNDHAEWQFEQLHCSSDGKAGLVLEGLAENGHDQSRWNIRIHLDLSDGHYRYEASPSE